MSDTADAQPHPDQVFVARLFTRVPHARVTIALIVVCFVVFALQAALARSLWSFPSGWLIALGGNFAPAVQGGQPWRLLSAVFLHGGLLHVAMNMIALAQAGGMVERLFGRIQVLVIFLLSGVFASLASLWWRQGGVSIGASGAVFGVMGALAAWLLIHRGEMPMGLLRDMRASVMLFIGYSLFFGFQLEGIDNAAHVGGLAAGLVLGAGMAMPVGASLHAVWRRPLAWVAIAAVVLAGAWLWQATPQVVAQHEQRQRFAHTLSDLSLREMAIAQRLQDIQDGLNGRRLTPQEAAERIEAEVASEWFNLRAQVDATKADEAFARRREFMLQYLQLREAGARMLARGLRSGDARALVQADNLRLRGDNLILQWQLEEARERVAGKR